MTQSSCKRDTKSKSHAGMKLAPVRLFSCKHPLSPLLYIIIIVSIITVFAGVLFVVQPGANHVPRASVTQDNHSVHTLRTFLRIRADPSMQIF